MLHMLKQEIYLPETMRKYYAQNEHTGQSEATSMENVITKYFNSEENLTMESSAKS